MSALATGVIANRRESTLDKNTWRITRGNESTFAGDGNVGTSEREISHLRSIDIDFKQLLPQEIRDNSATSCLITASKDAPREKLLGRNCAQS